MAKYLDVFASVVVVVVVFATTRMTLSDAFVIVPISSSSSAATLSSSSSLLHPTFISTTSTTLFIERWVADMIDQELYRQSHKIEFENEWMKKNKNAMLHTLNDQFPMTTDEDEKQTNFRQHVKDVKLASRDPQRYCADRCVATGNCDVYEDVYVLIMVVALFIFSLSFSIMIVIPFVIVLCEYSSSCCILDMSISYHFCVLLWLWLWLLFFGFLSSFFLHFTMPTTFFLLWMETMISM
jgi:hypothetical protein